MKLKERASPIKRRNNVVEVKFRGCEYIKNDPKDGPDYCGAKRQPGSSYCAKHHRICYRRQIAVTEDEREARAIAAKLNPKFQRNQKRRLGRGAGRVVLHSEDAHYKSIVSAADKLFGRGIG